MSDPNTILMQNIREQWGAAIAAACEASSVPQAFLAALVANESGGKETASRFEPGICTQILQVFLGMRSNLTVTGIHNPLGPDDLLPGWGQAMFSFALGVIRALASSTGLTQIMGWHYVALGLKPDCGTGDQLLATLRLMAAAAPVFDLDLAMPNESEAKQWFTWWNSGSPTGKTADPNYAENGVQRMLIYAALLNGASAAPPANVVN